MSQYETMDKVILQTLEGSTGMPLLFLHAHAHAVREESDRLAGVTGREAFRILDGRLQSLRKRGEISFSSKKGWALATKTPNVEHNRRPQGVRVDGPVGPHTQED